MIIRKTIQVKIEDAVFTFKKPNMKFLLELDSLKGKGGFQVIEHIFKSLERVTGLINEENEDIKNDQELFLNLPFDIINQVVNQWNIEVYGKPEAEEKKA